MKSPRKSGIFDRETRMTTDLDALRIDRGMKRKMKVRLESVVRENCHTSGNCRGPLLHRPR